ncbi:MAG: CBS domain-containing protein [Balneolales bacterium]
MLVREAINRHIKPLRAIDTAREAMNAMSETDQEILPVVDQTTNRLIGMVTRESAQKHYATVDSVLTIRDKNAIVTEPEQNIFETVRLMYKHNLSLLPVLDKEKFFLGVVERKHLFDCIIEVMNFTEYGSLVTIHFKENDFTLSQLVRIIETEGGLILGISVESPRENNPFYIVSIKLNLSDPSRIVNSLKRHGYIVDAQSTDNEDDRKYEARADEFMHYLNI